MSKDNNAVLNLPNSAPINGMGTITNGAGAQIDNSGKTVDNQDNADIAETPENGRISEDANDVSGFQAVIDRQNNLIDTLMNQIDSYQKQIETLVRNGAVIRDDQGTRENAALPGDFADNPAEHEDYIPLADLGKEIGKQK